ncbi:MAG: AAA family ATPase [Candidatus Eisenbacteria sp.]|nr:AAA family ATPase [Candidatus Eisenbacteria bacterium]
MNRVLFRHLELRGFGLFGRPTRFEFEPGLNVFVAPNESGKSTFLSGMLAVLFGLPEKSDPQLWGTTRFQSWELPLPFKGEVLLLSQGVWHRIQRDFATHRLAWTITGDSSGHAATAAAEGGHGDAGRPDRGDAGHRDRGDAGRRDRGETGRRDRGEANRRDRGGPRESDRQRGAAAGFPIQPPSLATDAWRSHFEDEHRPGGRGEPRRRYERHLRTLLGLDDVDLFRLTFCLTQDPEERSEDETIYRARQVPQGVQNLISGSGGRVHDVLSRIFDALAEVTQATGDLGLIRPGGKRPANQRTPGRLEEVEERLEALRGQLRGAGQALDRLQETQARLEALRQTNAAEGHKLADDRRLLQEWSRWSQHRSDLRAGRKRIVEIEKAVHQLEREEVSRQKSEESLAASFPEYHDAEFPFAERAEQFDALAAAEQERARLEEDLRAARERHQRLADEIERLTVSIQERFAHFTGRPHLLRDLDEWSRVRAELDRRRAELDELQAEAARCEAVIAETGHWAALDPAAEQQPADAQPRRCLQELRERLPQFLARAHEVEHLGEELRAGEGQLAGPLRAADQAPEALRQEAQAYKERHSLLQLEEQNAARRWQEAEAGARRLEEHSRGLETSARTITKRLGGGDQETVEGLPKNWTEHRERLAKKLECVREEGRLLYRIAGAQRRIRAGLLRDVVLPAIGGLLAVGAAVYVATHMPVPSLSLPFLATPLAGLLAAILIVLLTYQRSRGSSLRDLRSAEGRLLAVQRTMKQADEHLGPLGEVEAPELETLLEELKRYRELSTAVEAARAEARPAEEHAARRTAVGEAEAALTAFTERMAPLGEDPAALVATWRETRRRVDALRARLEELEPEIGPPDWRRRALEALPPLWERMRRLAVVLDAQVEQEGEAIIERLEQVSPADWQAGEQAAAAFEEAHARLADIAARRGALEERSPEGKTRIEALRRRDRDLAEACAPFDPATPREEIAAAAETYGKLEEQRQTAQARRDPLADEITNLEGRLAEASAGVEELRDPLAELLAPAAGVTTQARERLEKARALRTRLDQAAETRTRIIQSHGVDSADDLQLALVGLREENRRAGDEAGRLEERFVLFRELADAEPEILQQKQTELDKRIAAAEKSKDQRERQLHDIQQQAAEAHSAGRQAGNVAVLEIEVGALGEERGHLLRERDAYRIAFETLRQADERFSATHRQRLQERASEIFRQISLRQDRSVNLEEDFGIEILDGRGHSCAIRQLSQGARDQLALSLRLAVAELLAEDIRLPILLDDPFLSFDPERLAAMRVTLEQLAAERQVILLSHRAEFSDWGASVRVSC